MLMSGIPQLDCVCIGAVHRDLGPASTTQHQKTVEWLPDATDLPPMGAWQPVAPCGRCWPGRAEPKVQVAVRLPAFSHVGSIFNKETASPALFSSLSVGENEIILSPNLCLHTSGN